MGTPPPPSNAVPTLWRRIVEAIADGPTACMTPAQLASAIGIGEDETLDEVASMDVDGLLEIWEQSEGILVTLSALSAVRIGRHLVEQGPDLLLRWARLGDPEPSPPRASHVVRSSSSASLEFVVDPGPGPEELADCSLLAGNDRIETDPGSVRQVDGPACCPRPTRLIGTGLVPWPGPESCSTGHCPACGGGLLRSNSYCLCCDRWGRDRSEASAPRRTARPARSPAPAGFTDPDSLARATDLERRRRKERRGIRLALKFERQNRERLDQRQRRRNRTG